MQAMLLEPCGHLGVRQVAVLHVNGLCVTLLLSLNQFLTAILAVSPLL